MHSSTGYNQRGESLVEGSASTTGSESDYSNLRANLFGATSSSLRIKQPSNEIRQDAFESSKQEYIAECKRLLNGFKKCKQQPKVNFGETARHILDDRTKQVQVSSATTSSSTSDEIKRTLAIKQGGPPSSLDALERMLDQFDDLYESLKDKMITDFS